MDWAIEYKTEAQKDLKLLDRSQQIQVLKAIRKVSANSCIKNLATIFLLHSS